jgi:hypothetical protein
MESDMKTSALKLVTIPILAGALAMTGHGQIGPGRSVKGDGCVWEGPKAGCVMVTDRATDNIYNLLLPSGGRPEFGTGIYFYGGLHQGLTGCTGQPVDVTGWGKRKLNCSDPDRKKPSPY